MKNFLKEDTVIAFDIPGLISGSGKIKGIAMNGDIILGLGYIVEVISLTNGSIDKATYPYTHLVIYEHWFIQKKNKNGLIKFK